MSETPAKRLAIYLQRRIPGDRTRLVELGHVFGIAWPPDFIELMSITDGGEGWVGESYLTVFGIDELQHYNEPEFWPGLVLFGSSGGGEGFAFLKSSAPPGIVMANMVGPDPAVPQGDMATFIDRLESASLFAPLPPAND